MVGGFVVGVLADTLDWPEWVGRPSTSTHVAPCLPAPAGLGRAGRLLPLAVLFTVGGPIGFAYAAC